MGAMASTNRDQHQLRKEHLLWEAACDTSCQNPDVLGACAEACLFLGCCCCSPCSHCWDEGRWGVCALLLPPPSLWLLLLKDMLPFQPERPHSINPSGLGWYL